MPNHEVLALFRDKNTKKRYEIGSVYTTDDAERVEELQTAGFIGEPVKGKGKTANQQSSEEKGEKGAENNADDPK